MVLCISGPDGQQQRALSTCVNTIGTGHFSKYFNGFNAIFDENNF